MNHHRLTRVSSLLLAIAAVLNVSEAPVAAAGAAVPSAADQWHFDGPQALFVDQTQSSVSGLAYGAGRWVASGAGWVATLEADGRWTYPQLPGPYLGENWSRLAYIGGLFFLFGANTGFAPELLISEDGLDWTKAQGESGNPSPFTHGGSVRAVAYGNGSWVAVGAQWFSGEPAAGAIFRSTDGRHWSRAHRVGNPWRTVHGVAFADGRFIAVAELGTLLTSVNGADWTEIRPITDPGNGNSEWMSRNLTGICHGDLGWVITTSASGVALVSTDGVNWNTSVGTPYSGELNQSFFADGKYWFLMPGNAYTTTDAINWMRLTSLPGNQPVSLVARAPDGVQPRYLANGPVGSILSSDDGTQWEVALPASDAGWPHYLSALAVGTEWLVSGQGTARTDRNGPYDRTDIEPKQIWIPSLGMGFESTGVGVLALREQGNNWRRGAKAAFPDLLSTPEGVLAVSVRRGQLAAGFLSGATKIMNAPAVLPDLNRLVPRQTYKELQNSINWEYGRASLARTADGYDLFAETYSVHDGFNGAARIRWGHFTSADGLTWVLRSDGLNNVAAFPGIRGLAWGAGRFVAVSEGSAPGSGADFISSHRIYTSTDGESYSPVDLSGLVPSLNGEGLTGVAYADGKFVAIGNNGRILCSSNGMDWATVRSSDGRHWNRIRHLGYVWGVVGNAGWVGFSTDGETWNSHEAGTESDLSDVAQKDGQFMLVGSHATVLFSQSAAPPENLPPTDLALDIALLPENQTVGTMIGLLAATDPNAGDTFTFTLVAGVGDADNASFAIVGSELRTATSFDFEGKDSYAIRIRATDSGGLSFEKALTITVLNVNEPPAASAGPDQTLVAGMSCEATLQLNGSASSDPEGDALTYSWVIYTQTPSGPVASAPVLGAVNTWMLLVGTYEAELTVTSTANGQTLIATDRAVITVLPSAPVLTALDPAAAYAGGAEFTLTVSGGCFQQGATVYWNGSARPTTVVNSAQLAAVISASDLNTGLPITTALITVINGDGQVSNPLAFSIVAQTVGTVDTSMVPPGGTGTVSTAPTTAGDPGVAVSLQNNGGGPVSVVAATYDTKPVGETAFRIDNGHFVDVQMTGADSTDVATVYFYYPSDIKDNREDKIKLRYFDGTNWITVLSSGGAPAVKDTTDNLDTTVSGGRFAVILDSTSTPKITELNGTVFGMFDPSPQIDAIGGPMGPVALGTPVTISVQYAALDDPDAVEMTVFWGDGTQSNLSPTLPGLASTTKTYAIPGVYSLTIRVTDEHGNSGVATFEYVVVYDPNGGFVTGGGWINSPVGAFHPGLQEFAGVTGKASFGFVAKYLKGANVPTGDTEFQFRAGSLNFKSTAYQWLVVAGARAQFKGWGTINGADGYGFLLTTIDGALLGTGQPDRFRIKIWDSQTDIVIYDNQAGTGDNSELTATTILGGGSVVIHKGK